MTLALAGFAGCLGGDGDGDGDDGSDGDWDTDPIGDDTVSLDGFAVPSDSVLPQDDISDADQRQVGEMPLMAQPQGSMPNQYETATTFAENMSRLGIEIPIDTMTQNTIFDIAYVAREPLEGEWWNWSTWNYAPRPTRLDPDELLYDSHRSQQDSYNWDYWEDEEYDDVVVQQRTTFDREERKELVHQCQEILHERGPRNITLFPEISLPYNAEKWDGITTIEGLGPANHLTFNNAEPLTDNDTLVSADAIDNEFVALTPWGYGNEMDLRISRMMYDRLLWLSEDGTSFQNRLATNVDFVDNTTIDIEIRDDHQFHDGEDVTAEDVKFSYDINHPDNDYNTGFPQGFANVDNIEVTGDYSLTINLTEPLASFEILALSRVPIAPKHYWEDHFESSEYQNRGGPTSHYTPPELIGSGPMEFDQWDSDAGEVHLTRNDDHFDPLAYETRIQTSVPGAEQALTEVANGSIDIVTDYSGEVRAMYAIAEEEDAVEIASTVGCVPHWITINNDNPPNHLDAFRRAQFHAWDSQELLDNIYDGRGETGANSMISPALEFWFNDDLEPYPYDLQAAANELVEAGFVWDEENGDLYMPEGEHCLDPEDVAPLEEYDDGFSRDMVLCD